MRAVLEAVHKGHLSADEGDDLCELITRPPPLDALRKTLERLERAEVHTQGEARSLVQHIAAMVALAERIASKSADTEERLAKLEAVVRGYVARELADDPMDEIGGLLEELEALGYVLTR
jgi:ABC-type transporter Mla subunit MlaD